MKSVSKIGRLLIANRGEIACRIIRTARRMGIATVAVYSEADADSPHVREADLALPIGPAPARDSYLRAEAILKAAADSGTDAIHPGYGFLSENAGFAQVVIDAGLTWVGPPPAAIRAMGLKDAAKALMAAAGVPVTPGYLGEDQSPARLAAEAQALGWPVLIKAVAGGGGKGMRRVEAAADFAAALDSCRREAAASFGDDRVLLERYVARPRHIEVQLFADRHGGVVHLFERDCSLQRRHQKVIEEAPAPGMTPQVRAVLCEAAVRAARAVGYEGAGTVEFIADASQGLSPDRVWFMEMNTRLQVEHPVTEAVTGLDLVEWQLRVAAGEPLPLAQDQIALNGWAMEARLCAEDPARGFLPSIGVLARLRLPGAGVRVDAGVEPGGEVSAFYDPMIAKLIAHGPDRAAAARALAAACRQVEAWPVRVNAAFLARCLSDPGFLAGKVHTGLIAEAGEALAADPPPSDAVWCVAAQARLAAAVELAADKSDPWSALTGFRLGSEPSSEIVLQTGGEIRALRLSGAELAATPSNILVQAGEVVVFDQGAAYAFTDPQPRSADAATADGAVRAPMPGRVIAVSAASGERVTRGQPLLTLEAMKMEHGLTAPLDGIVTRLAAQVGDQVREGDVLAVIAPD